jgi:hypothetical protein
MLASGKASFAEEGGGGGGGIIAGPDAAVSASVREPFLALVHSDTFLHRMLLHMVNHRVQDFQDPLTSTLVLMATAPLQFVLCESGLLVFKTNLLPVMPYSLLHSEERAQLRSIVERLGGDALHETIESSGQYTLTVLSFTRNQTSSATVHLMCKARLLLAFVELMRRQQQQPQQQHHEPNVNETIINHTLSSIVLQRFWSRVSTPSDVVNNVMHHLSSVGGGGGEEGGGAAVGTSTTHSPPPKRPKLL